MTIYLDAVWLLNFLIDYMLLLLTDHLARLHTSRIRLAVGAFIASSMVPLTIYYPDLFITSTAGKILFSILIIWSSYGFKNINRMLKLLFLFYLMSFSIGGGLFAIYFFMEEPLFHSQGTLLTTGSGLGDPISWLFVVIGFPIVWLFTKRRMDKHVEDKVRYDMKIPITIKIGRSSKSTKAFIDSGNQLKDPFTAKPVIVCDEAFLKEWFTTNEWEQLRKVYEEMDMDSIPDAWLKRVQIIPYQGVEGRNQFIFTIVPDELIIYYDMKEIHTNRFLIGIQFGSLTEDGSYHCLLHPELIQTAITYSA